MKVVRLASTVLLMLLVGCTNQGQRSVPAHSQQQAVSATTATSQSIPPVSAAPHEKTSDEVWNEATPATRRSILASHVRKTWKNVSVEVSGATMTLTHPGMDERGAHQIITDIGQLVTEAGLRRIDFVRAGGICEVAYEQPHCEYAGGCGPYLGHSGDGWVRIPAGVQQVPCPPHTWVYDVPGR
jgi:hypothetical protein